MSVQELQGVEVIADLRKVPSETGGNGPGSDSSGSSSLGSGSEPLFLSIDHLSYAVDAYDPTTKKKYMKEILKDVSAYARPGELLCILGSSGAGKTTLANLLAGRTNGGYVTGDIRVNDYPKENFLEIMRHRCGYVLQHEVMYDTLTVRESLEYQARLRGIPTSEVTRVIEKLSLGSCEHTLVKNISGGQRKRASIGLELLSHRSGALLCDEPTSGVDSAVAVEIVKMLKELALSENRTVIATIHQPSSEIFLQFDRIILMSGGRIVFFGDANDVVPFFAAAGFPTPTYSNPADHFITVMHTQDAGKIADFYAQSEFAERAIQQRGEIPKGTGQLLVHEDYRVGLLQKTAVLTARSFRASSRERLVTTAKLGQTIFLALLIGLIYLDIGSDQRSIQDRSGVLFFICTNQMFAAVTSVVLVFPREKMVYMKEHSSGLYSTLAFYLTKVIADFPLQIVFPILFSCVCYYMVGFQPEAEKFFVFVAFVILLTQSAAALGFVISAAARDAEMAFAMVPIVIIPGLVFGGLFVNRDSVPVYFYPFEYLSVVLYTFEGIARNEYEGLQLHCTEGEFIKGGVCPVTRGEQVIDQLNFQFSLAEAAGILIALYVFFRVLAYLFLRRSVSRASGALLTHVHPKDYSRMVHPVNKSD